MFQGDPNGESGLIAGTSLYRGSCPTRRPGPWRPANLGDAYGWRALSAA